MTPHRHPGEIQPVASQDFICMIAAQKNDINPIRTAVSNGYIPDNSISIAAAVFGNVDVIDWMFSNGLPVSDRISHVAAVQGHTNIIDWAHHHEFVMESNLDKTALSHKRYDTYKWICDNIHINNRIKIPKSVEEMHAAIVEGDLDRVISGARFGYINNDDLSDEWKMLKAEAHLCGHEHIVEWIAKNIIENLDI